MGRGEAEVKLDVLITDGIHKAAENTANNNKFSTIFRDSIKSRLVLDKVKIFCQDKDNLKKIFALLVSTPKKAVVEKNVSNERKQTVRISKRQQEYINSLTSDEFKEMIVIQIKHSILERKIGNTTDKEDLALLIANLLSLKLLGLEISI